LVDNEQLLTRHKVPSRITLQRSEFLARGKRIGPTQESVFAGGDQRPPAAEITSGALSFY